MIGIPYLLDGDASNTDGLRYAIHHDIERSHVVRVPDIQYSPFVGQILHNGIHCSACGTVQGGLVAVISDVHVGFQFFNQQFYGFENIVLRLDPLPGDATPAATIRGVVCSSVGVV